MANHSFRFNKQKNCRNNPNNHCTWWWVWYNNVSRRRSADFILRESMAQHPSLRGASALGAKRNVLKRFERVELLKKRGQWKDGERVTGLRKTKPDA